MKLRVFLFSLALFALPGQAFALERTVSQPNNTNSLGTAAPLIDALITHVRDLQNQVGAFEASLTTTSAKVDEIITCNDNGMIFDTDNGCTNISSNNIISHEVSAFDGVNIDRTINLAEPGMLVLTCSNRANYTGTIKNAGIQTLLYINGSLCSQALSFEGESSSITFRASTACTKMLPAGSHTINCNDNGTVARYGLNSASGSLSYAIIRD